MEWHQDREKKDRVERADKFEKDNLCDFANLDRDLPRFWCNL